VRGTCRCVTTEIEHWETGKTLVGKNCKCTLIEREQNNQLVTLDSIVLEESG
jgi:hypothetical protein